METFATNRIPHEARNREDYDISTPPRASKKRRPTSKAQRDVDEQTPAIAHGRLESNVDSPAIQSEIKKARAEADGGEVVSLMDKQILSAILRGVDITEVY